MREGDGESTITHTYIEIEGDSRKMEEGMATLPLQYSLLS